VNEGTKEHDDLLQFAVQVYAEQGRQAWKVDKNATTASTQQTDRNRAWKREQNTASISDGGVIENGEEHELEAEVHNSSKPANVLNNVARAIHADKPVIIVTYDEDFAERIVRYLRQPYAEMTDDRVLLYNSSTPVTPDGKIPLLPKDATRSRWHLTPNGQLQLRADGKVLAEGLADEPIESFDFDTPHAVSRDDREYVVDADGETITSYSTAEAASDEWSAIYAPHVPIDIHYLTDVRVQYKDGDTLSTVDAEPTWSQTATGKRDRYQAGVSEIITSKTVKQDGAEMVYDEYRETVREIYRAFTGRDNAPGDGEFGRAEPDYIQTKRRREEGSYTKYLQDRQLIHPRGLISPHLPFIDNEE
jgi:hypothetical protein